MIVRISHATRYVYDRPVFLEPHVLRFRPRTDGTQRLNHFALRVEPEPAGMTEILDAEGNSIRNVWFDNTTTLLRVEMQCEVETLRINPFDFLPADAKTLEFLANLTRHIHENYRTEVREQGEPLPASVTKERRAGTCRDLALLFMESCRAEGLTARFVSGYHAVPADEHDLHAWAEVMVPGGGWRGFDPTDGLAVADRHVAVAAAAIPRDAAPVTGGFRGTGANCQMEVELTITAA